MIQLIKNEGIKLSKKTSTWIMLILLVALAVALNAITGAVSNHQASSNETFATQPLLSFLNLFVVVIAASSVAEEFSRGTIKFLLIRPYHRWEIFLAKFINTFLFALIGTVILLLVTFFSGQLFLKGESPLLKFAGFGSWNALEVAFVHAGVNLLLILFYLALTMFISTAMRSQAFAVGLGLGALFGGPTINQLLAIGLTKYPWLKWNLFNPVNIKETIPQLAGEQLPEYLSLDFWQSLGGLAIYGALLYFFASWIFSARDVALS